MKNLESKQCKRNHLVLLHLNRFIESLNLLDSDLVYVGVSAGVDSMSLVYMLKWLEINSKGPKVKAIHVNHGTRQENIHEEDLVRSFCKELSIPLIVEQLQLRADCPNFENTARIERYKIFKSKAKMNSLIALAHHIDDSFEWSLMQQMRTTEPKSCLGIPVVNGIIRRPFMCLTKKHIIDFANRAGIEWLEDRSNSNLRYDRNFIRDIISNRLSTRYPALLKNYVHRSNKLAKTFGANIQLSTQKEPSKIIKRSWKQRAVCLINGEFKSNFNGQEEKVKSGLIELSNTNRGTTHDQVAKLLKMPGSGKNGPLSFSGGVLGYSFKGLLILLSEEGQREVELLDDLLVHQLREIAGASQIPERLLKSRLFYNENYFPPFLCFGPKSNEESLRGQRSVNPLLPKTTTFCLEREIWFQSLVHVLDSKQKNLSFYF